MSLFLGNLSPRIRRDELERVFRRFGRSNVQLKDGYGFVIYDVTANAERALRALRGKNICGEAISLTWSNKQPRHFQRFSRNPRFSEPYHGRNFLRKEEHSMRNKGSQDRRDFARGTKHPNNNHEGTHMVDLPDKDVDYSRDDVEDHGGENGQNTKEGVVGEGESVEPNPMENDRWGDPVVDSLEDHVVDNGTEFERYEPYHGLDRRDENENHPITSSYGSPAQGSSPEKAMGERSGDKQKPQQTCYICGMMGHIMRNCPRADASRRDKFSSFGRGERGIKRLRPTSWGRLNAGRDPLLPRRHVNDRRAIGSRNPTRSTRRRDNFLPSKINHRSELRKESRGKKRSRNEQKTPKRHRGKKGRSDRSAPHSESTTSISRSNSLASKSISGLSSRSRSRSVSSERRSVSSSSRSFSSSSYSKSGSSRNRSRSSSPRSLSLSVSLGVQVQNSPNKLPCDSPKGLLLEKKQHVEGDASSENSELKGPSAAAREENALSSFKTEDELHQHNPNHSTPVVGLEDKISSMAPSKKDTSTAEISSEDVRETDIEKSKPVEMDFKLAPFGKLNSQIPATNDSLRISSEEMYMVLKHYGVPVPNESELHLSPNTYFGAARLWPWEMIYYRRMKKGPISTENYARRVAQNQEFGIVDKYIRSSSGWGERDLNNL